MIYEGLGFVDISLLPGIVFCAVVGLLLEDVIGHLVLLVQCSALEIVPCVLYLVQWFSLCLLVAVVWCGTLVDVLVSMG